MFEGKGLTLALINSERKTLVKCRYERVKIVPTNRFVARHSSSDSLLILDQLPNISPITFNYSLVPRCDVTRETNLPARSYRVRQGGTFSMKSFYQHQNSCVITFRIHIAFAGIFRVARKQTLRLYKNLDSSKYKTVEAESRSLHGSLHHVSCPFPVLDRTFDYWYGKHESSIKNGLSVKRPTSRE